MFEEIEEIDEIKEFEDILFKLTISYNARCTFESILDFFDFFESLDSL